MYLSLLPLRLVLMTVVILGTFGNGALQAQNHRKPAKTTALLWSVNVPAGRYFKSPQDFWSGPLTHFKLDRTIRLIEIDYDTEQLPVRSFGLGGACAEGEIGLMEAPNALEVDPPSETSLQFSTLAPNLVDDIPPSSYPQYTGFGATLDLRGKNVVFQAGTKLWLYLAAQYPACDLPSSGTVTIQYEILP
jgi:hypothetical protein